MQFAVQGFRRQQSVSLLIEAPDAADARQQAQAMGCSVFEVRAARRTLLRRPASVASFPLLQFNQGLLLLLRSGLSLVEAIDTLAERESRADARQVLVRLRSDLSAGLSLSTALERQPAVFPPLYVAGVRANEQTGALAEAIERFIVYRAQAELLRKRIVGAAIYPAMILAVGLLVIAFLLFYVVPRFSQVFLDMGDRIPAMSRLLLQWGQFVHAHGVAVLAVILVLGLAAGWVARQPGPRARVLAALLRLPRVGEMLRIYRLARFYRALGLLLQAGIPIVPALDMVPGLLPQDMHAALRAAQRDIGQGRSISSGFEANGLSTAVALRLLRVAERTGQMGQMLERCAIFHEEDMAQAIDWFVRLFEPLLMIGIGVVIGVVVLLMYAPIFELAGSIQ